MTELAAFVPAAAQYDPSATMERVTEEGVIATANVDAWFWRCVQLRRALPPSAPG